jgi:hypothetical protein
MSFCLPKPKNWHSMEIERKFKGLHIWNQIHWAFRHMTRLNTHWTPPGHLWVPVNANEWVLNTSWTPIECAWMPMSEWEYPLNTHECAWPWLSECQHPFSVHNHLWVIIECNSPWCDHEKVLICVRTVHSLNACECAWLPLSQYWTHPECLWVHKNACE